MKKFYFVLISLISAIFYVFQATAQGSVSFTSSTLKNTFLSNPTSLQFGPDGRLYVSQQNGTIQVYTVKRNDHNDYEVTGTETILLIKNIPNHNDNGVLNPSITNRQITGILVTGTAQNPVIFVGSSDPRIGGGGTAGDLNLDTNSGIISKLTWNGAAWAKIDVVIGLPRSEENHATNGLQLDKVNNILYVAQGGNTNAGAPSNNFAFLCEVALSAAILKIDLGMIESQYGGTYIIPTLDDPTRENVGENGHDVNDPFGGNDGLNQAKLVAGGPVQIYSPGYRNAYDLVITETPGKEGRFYTVDNGANGGWGGHPDHEGATGNPLTTNVTNNYVEGEPGSTTPGPNDPVINNKDGLHLISKPGLQPKYGGHPNPIRANPAGAGWYWFDNNTSTAHFELTSPPLPVDWPPIPVEMANPIEGDFQNPGTANGALHLWNSSTNGLAEYTSEKFFNGAMQGDLLTVSFDGNLYRIKLNEEGTAVEFVESIASGFASTPLDVTAQGNGEVFEGTIWVANYVSNNITIFEPEGNWQVVNSVDSSLPIARHENAFVELNDKFYLIGGRETTTMSVYDPDLRIWTVGAKLPFVMHHFQAATWNGKIYILSAYKGTYKSGNEGNSESPVENIYIYDPELDKWEEGPAIPRPRGSAGVVVFNNEFYLFSGIVNGHHDGWVNWVDKFNPVTEVWVELANAPRERDHFHAVEINGKVYLAGGRKTNSQGDVFGVTLGEVDVYDLATNTWETLPESSNVLTHRAGTASVAFDGELYLIGGESPSQSLSHNECEVFDPDSKTWRSGPLLNTGRHGTGAFVYKGSIFIAAGSANKGGGPPLFSMENFLAASTCSGDIYNADLDDDNDCYSNYDETLNGTNPCSPASRPNDFDADCISDLLDPDDDNDGIPDTEDAFAWDAQNGMSTAIPVFYPFLNGDPGTGLFGLGFTGLMTNKVADYLDLFDSDNPNLIMGGAVGIATVPANSGDAKTNNQEYAFQFGFKINPSDGEFTIKSKLQGTPFFNGIPLNELADQTQGIYIGNGNQDNYLKVVLAANNGNPGIQVYGENAGVEFVNATYPVTGILTSGIVYLYFEIDPVAGTATLYHQTGNDPIKLQVGSPINLPSAFTPLLNGTVAMATGIIASAGSGNGFSASWDFLNITTTNPYVNEEAPSFYNIFMSDPTPDFVLDLNTIFNDDDGPENLVYEIISVEEGAFISGYALNSNIFSMQFNSNLTGSSKVVVKATDADNLFIEYEFRIQVIPQPTPFLRVNSGGPRYGTWQADKYYSGGVTFTSPVSIAKTEDDILYQSERNRNFTYELPVPQPGYYRLNIHFAEIYHGVQNSQGVGARVFTVEAEGVERLKNYDIIKRAGATATAIIEVVDSVFVTDGALSLKFTTVVDNAKVSAIEIAAYTLDPPVNSLPIVENPGNRHVFKGESFTLQLQAFDADFADVLTYQATGLPAALTLNMETGLITGTVTANVGDYPVIVTVNDGHEGGETQMNFVIKVVDPAGYALRINAGGPQVDYGDEAWAADYFFVTGTTYKKIVAIANTDKDEIYQTERYGKSARYEIAMPGPGDYTVKLHFAEIFHTEAGKRVFNVNIENNPILENYDIVQVAGGANIAITESANVTVTDGVMSIDLITLIDNAKISAIEVTSCIRNTEVTASGTTLTATLTGAGYQWINCNTNADIPGATDRSFTPTQSGSFKVRMTKDGCTAVSACQNVLIVGVPEDRSDKISVYPNPSQTRIKVQLPVYSREVQVDITDTQGRLVMRTLKDETMEVDIDIQQLQKGLYILHVQTETLRKTIKLIVN